MTQYQFWKAIQEGGMIYAKARAEAFKISPTLIDLWARVYLARQVA